MQTYLSVLLSTIILSLLPFKNRFRSNVILPISFLIIWVFLAFRYNYGVDYINYNRLFYQPELYDRSLNAEPLFWWVMGLFKYYYQFIIFQTSIICLTYFYFVKKYITPRYYWLFFILFMCHTGMMFTVTTAMRSGFASLVFIWATELFYLRKNKPILYLFSIYIAYLFHNSSIILIIFPFANYIINKLSVKVWITIVIIGFIISITSISNYIETVLSLFSDSHSLSAYSDYIGGKFTDSSFSNALTHLFLVIPGYYIYIYIVDNETISTEYRKIASITLIYMLLHIIGIDTQNRVTVFTYLFYIISITLTIENVKKKTQIKSIVLVFVLFSAIWSTMVMFHTQKILDPEGSYWFYKTIFDIPKLP